MRAWQLSQPADPAPQVWGRVLDRIGDSKLRPDAAPLHHRHRRAGLIVWTIAAAAAVFAFVFLGRTLWPAKKDPPNATPEVVVNPPEKQPPGSEGEESSQEVFALLAPDELRVLSMDGDDAHVEIDGRMVKTLLVGEPPVPDALLLPTSFERTRMIGWVDPTWHFDDWDVPMIVDPEVLAKDWHP